MQRDDALTNAKLLGQRTYSRDDPSKLVSENRGFFDERERAFAIENVAEGNSACGNFHEDFAAFGQHNRDVAELEGLCGRRGGGQDYSAHKLRERRRQFGHGVDDEIQCQH